jgi:phosphatidylglycerophosphatase A
MNRPAPGDAPLQQVVPHLPRASWSDPAVLIVTGFGSGFLRPAPGTWGTLIALGLWWWLIAGLGWPQQVAVIVAVVAVGTWLTHVVGRRYGVHDDPRIVIDEFAGLWLALVAVPPTLAAALAGFLLFRAFDIAKPWPVRWADRRVPGAAGVMLDDLIAGAMAAVLLHGGLWMIGP